MVAFPFFYVLTFLPSLIHFTVIASEAKQSRAEKQGLDCFVAALLAMTN
jgi:hypothetical protein